MQFKKHAGYYLRLLTLLLVILEVLFTEPSFLKRIGFLIILILVTIIDTWLLGPFSKPKNYQVIEIAGYVSFFLLGFIQLWGPTTILIIYYYLNIVTTAEITVRQTPRPKHIIILQFVIYFLFFTIPKAVNFNYHNWTGYVQLVLSPYTVQFWSTYLISYLYLNLLEKNRAIDGLNKELMSKVDQLQDYSNKIKELTLIEERQRISQNLHDMLGHSLIGLRLHLDALNQTIDKDPEKSHQILDKSKDIIDDSLVELRETVNELKETKELVNLQKALEALRDSISITDEVKVDLQIHFDINKLDISVKDMIYKTSQEFITNSLKHGHSSLITIKLRLKDNNLLFDLTNNGLNAGNIVASNGINGIKDRVQKLNGKVVFANNKPSGFKTDINLPIGVNNND